MSYEEQRFEEVFPKSSKLFTQNYSFTQIPDKLTPIEIRIVAKEVPAVYSFELLPEGEGGDN
jgi:hypothetical protein